MAAIFGEGKIFFKLEKGRICGQMLDVSTDKGQLT